MKCVFCDSELIKDKQTIERRVKDQLVYINNVPVDLCKSCGEVYVDDDIVTEMNNLLKVLNCQRLQVTTTVDFNSFKEQSATVAKETTIAEDYNNFVTL